MQSRRVVNTERFSAAQYEYKTGHALSQADRIAVARAAVSRALARPTESSNVNVLARAIARNEMHIEELARLGVLHGRESYAETVTANADMMWIALQFVIASAQGRSRLVCSDCAGWLNSPAECAVLRDVDGTKSLIHALGSNACRVHVLPLDAA